MTDEEVDRLVQICELAEGIVDPRRRAMVLNGVRSAIRDYFNGRIDPGASPNLHGPPMPPVHRH